MICAGGGVVKGKLWTIGNNGKGEGVDDKHNESLPSSQCGAVRPKGTDIANHLVRSMLDYARMMNLSIVILFVDQGDCPGLVKFGQARHAATSRTWAHRAPN